jgi:hypothetical protein
VLQVYRDLIPVPRIEAWTSETLENIANLTWESVNLNVNAFIRLSGIFYLPRDLYSAKLRLLSLQVAYRTQKRELLVSLWEAFASYELLKEQDEKLTQIIQCLDRTSDTSFLVWQQQLNDELSKILEAQAELDHKVRLLLSTHETVSLYTETLPPYTVFREDDLFLSSNIACLNREVLTIEILYAIARADGAKIDRWPRPNFFIYGGNLFDHRHGSTESLRWDSLVLSAGVDYEIDVSGRRTAHIRDAEFDAKLITARVEIEQANLAHQLRGTFQELNRVECEIVRLAQRKQAILLVMSFSDSEQLLTSIQQIYSIDREYAMLQNMRLQLSATLLFHDDAFWSDHSFEATPLE